MRNVILLIGDGLGAGHLEAARSQPLVSGVDDRLRMERLPVVGLMRTTADGGAITDSAAAATAMATGVKTRVGRAGVDRDGRPLVSIAESLARTGVALGFVSSGALVNATPAGFLAHVVSRDDTRAISRQLAESPATVLLGGSSGFDAEEEATRRGFTVLRGADAFLVAAPPRVLALVDGLADSPPPPAAGTAPRASLADLTGKAMSLLDARGRCGFFLIVEEDGIDDWSHENDLPRMLNQLRRFDEAVEASVSFAQDRGNTLVIVTADHETGGLLFLENGSPENPVPRWSTREHSGGSVPLFAFGPRAEEFGGVSDNTDLPRRLRRLFENRAPPTSDCGPPV